MGSKVVRFVKRMTGSGRRKIKEEGQQPEEGNQLIVDVAVGDDTFEMKVLCPVCGGEEYWLSEDHQLLYCSKCRTTIAQRCGDSASFGEVGWVV